jgi:hypothetical protein
MPSQSAGAGAFPLPLFSPLSAPGSASRRLAQRYSRAAAVTQSANRAFQSVNLLSVAFSNADGILNHSSNNSAGARNQPIQNRMLAHIYSCSSRFVCRRDTLVSECDDPLFDSTFLSQHLRQNGLDAYISRAKASLYQSSPIVSRCHPCRVRSTLQIFFRQFWWRLTPR